MKSSAPLFTLLFLLLLKNSFAEEFYVDPVKGKDSNSGSHDAPLATLWKAVDVANNLTETGSIDIKLYPGLYVLSKKIDVRPQRVFSSSQRISISALILPDDHNWTPDKMPVIQSLADTSTNWGFPCSVAIMASTNHVTIRGLKFIGNPNPNAGLYYPVGRESQTAEDLQIVQCVFIGDRYSSPIQVGILTCGHQTTIDHCIFYNCRNAVVFWRVEKTQRNNSMTHCIVYGAYQAAVWTAKPDSNFSFHNNVITHSEFAWIKNYYNKDVYRFNDCVITENDHYRGEWQQPDTLVDKKSYDNDLIETNIVKTGHVQLVDRTVLYMEDSIPNNYLNLEPGSLGYDLNAGIFMHSQD